MPTPNIIQAEELTKKFWNFTAVNAISLSVKSEASATVAI